VAASFENNFSQVFDAMQAQRRVPLPRLRDRTAALGENPDINSADVLAQSALLHTEDLEPGVADGYAAPIQNKCNPTVPFACFKQYFHRV